MPSFFLHQLFHSDKLVVLINGFQKKTQKTPKSEIEKAKSIMAEYYEQKRNENGNENLERN